MIARFPQCASSLAQAAESPSTSRARALGRPRKNGSSSSPQRPRLRQLRPRSRADEGEQGDPPVRRPPGLHDRSDPVAAEALDNGRIGSRRYRGRAGMAWASSKSASPAGPRASASLALAAAAPISSDRVAVVATPAPDDEVPGSTRASASTPERLRASDVRAHAELAHSLTALIPADPFSDDALWLLAAEGTSDKAALRSPGSAESARGDAAGGSVRPGSGRPSPPTSLATASARGASSPRRSAARTAPPLRLPGTRSPACPRAMVAGAPPERSPRGRTRRRAPGSDLDVDARSRTSPERVVTTFPDRRADFEEFPAA